MTEEELSFLQAFIVFGLFFIGGVTLLLSVMSTSFIGGAAGVGTAFSAYLYENQCILREKVDS